MPISLKSIINKEDRTPREAGLLLMYYMKAQLEGKAFPLDTAEISKLERKLTFKPDKYKYDTFAAFYDAIKDMLPRVYDAARRIAGAANLLKLYIRAFDEHSRQDEILYSLPLTLTDKGYEEYFAAATAAEKEKLYSFYTIFSIYLYKYLELYNNSPMLIASSIYNGFAQAQSEPIKSKSIKEYYQETNFDEYLITPEHPEGLFIFDEDCTTKELETALNRTTDVSKEELKKIQEAIERADKFYYEDNTNGIKSTFPIFEKYNCFFPYDYKNIDTDLKKGYAHFAREYEKDRRVPALFTIKLKNKPLPKDTTVFILLLECLKWIDAMSGETPAGLLFVADTRTPAKQLRELKGAAPTLFNALCDQIRHDIPQFEELTDTELLKATIKGEELRALNIEILADALEINLNAIKEYVLKSKRTSALEKIQAKNGVIHETATGSRDLRFILARDKYGRKTKNPEMPTPHTSIKEIEGEDIAAIYESEIYSTLKIIKAYNFFIETCAAGLNVKFLKCAEFPKMSFVEYHIETLNRELYTAYRNIEGDEKTKAERERIFKEKFKPVDPENIKLNPEILETTAESLRIALKDKIGAQWIKKSQQIIEAIARSESEE